MKTRMAVGRCCCQGCDDSNPALLSEDFSSFVLGDYRLVSTFGAGLAAPSGGVLTLDTNQTSINAESALIKDLSPTKTALNAMEMQVDLVGWSGSAPARFGIVGIYFAFFNSLSSDGSDQIVFGYVDNIGASQGLYYDAPTTGLTQISSGDTPPSHTLAVRVARQSSSVFRYEMLEDGVSVRDTTISLAKDNLCGVLSGLIVRNGSLGAPQVAFEYDNWSASFGSEAEIFV